MPDSPILDSLMSAWFHQDLDLGGDSVEEILEAWRATSTSAERHRLRVEIARWLSLADRDPVFEGRYCDEVDLRAMGYDPGRFLRTLDAIAADDRPGDAPAR